MLIDLYILRSLVLVSLLQCAAPYKNFQLKIPNGGAVPFPCKPGKLWEGVGHMEPDGTGTRNPFGRDFEAAGYLWTAELCRKDSDGDGISNGNELGDPDCVWRENEIPRMTDGLSHPGICDPWDSMTCSQKTIISPKYSTQSTWLQDNCKMGGFNCPALADRSIRTITARIPDATPLPAKITIYECQIFDIYDLGVPRDKDFHMVAVTPVIGINKVAHHIVLFGCTDDSPVPPGPFECGMVPSLSCREFLHVWTVGLDGECYHPESGIKLGKAGFKKIALQIHWTNYQERPDLTDNSGLVLHYTPNLKRYDAGVFLVGSARFYLPPKQEHVVVKGSCASGCTKQILRGAINITAAWNHMHYTGKDMIIEVRRQDKHYTYLTHESTYDYDSPQIMIFMNPVELRPGDSMITKCGFSTLKRNTTTSFGDATLDEMCFGFITYYPKQNMTQPWCLDYLSVSLCDPSTLNGCSLIGRYIKMINSTDIYRDISMNCKQYSPCVGECKDTLLKYMRSDPCLQGNVWTFIQTEMLRTGSDSSINFLSMIASCKDQVALAMNPAFLEMATTTEMMMPSTRAISVRGGSMVGGGGATNSARTWLFTLVFVCLTAALHR